MKQLYVHIYDKEKMHAFDSLEPLLQKKDIRVTYITRPEEMGVRCSEAIFLTDDQEEALEAVDEEVTVVGLVNESEYFSGAEYVIEEIEEDIVGFIEDIFKRKSEAGYIVVETGRLLIRESTVADVDSFYLFYPQAEWPADIPELAADRETEYRKMAEYRKYQYGLFEYGTWTIVQKETGAVIGRAGIECTELDGEPILELGYFIGKKYQNKGYASEACLGILEFAREKLIVKELYAFISPDNHRSRKVAKKLGFKKKRMINRRGSSYLSYIYKVEDKRSGR